LLFKLFIVLRDGEKQMISIINGRQDITLASTAYHTDKYLNNTRLDVEDS